MSVLKVGVLLTGLTALFVWVGSVFGGMGGAIIAFALAAAMNLGAVWFSHKVVLRMTRAVPMQHAQAPWLFAMAERLAQRAGIPTPSLYLIDDPQPNAFATGRGPDQGVVAFNSGLLEALSPEEVEGVLAHEIGHIKSRDTLTMGIVATLAGGIMMLAQLGQILTLFGGNNEEGDSPLAALAVIIIAPIAATLVQLGISRAREYEADATAARLVGSPQGLIGALSKLEHYSRRIPSHMPPQAAHMCIANPFSGARGAMASLFSTHPPMEQRIQRLREVGRSLD